MLFFSYFSILYEQFCCLCNNIMLIYKKTILSLHNDLMIAAENFEAVNSWSLLLWLGNLCLHTVSNIYFIIDWVLKKWDNEVAWPLIRCLSIWLMGFVFQLLLLHIACDYASSQVKLFPAEMQSRGSFTFRLFFAVKTIEIATRSEFIIRETNLSSMYIRRTKL